MQLYAGIYQKEKNNNIKNLRWKNVSSSFLFHKIQSSLLVLSSEFRHSPIGRFLLGRTQAVMFRGSPNLERKWRGKRLYFPSVRVRR